MRRSKRRRELQDKWNKRKKQKNITKNIAIPENDGDNNDAHSKTEVLHTKSPHQTSINEKEAESFSKQRKQNNKNLLEVTPMNKSKIRLKQTKLNFQTTQSTKSDTINKGPLLQSRPHVKLGKNQKVTQLVTSTPLHPRVKSKLIPTLEIDNITEIGSLSKELTDNTSNLKNSSRLENETPKKKIQKSLRRSPRSKSS